MTRIFAREKANPTQKKSPTKKKKYKFVFLNFQSLTHLSISFFRKKTGGLDTLQSPK